MDMFSLDKPIIGDLARVHLIKRIFEIANEDRCRILDVGCGEGQLWLPFLDRVDHLEISGIDRDQEKIEEGKRELKKINLVCGNIYELSSFFPEKHFNIVVSTQVFSYLRSLKKALDEIQRLLVENGKLLFTVGCTKYRKSWKDQFRRRIAGWFLEKHYFREYDEKELEDILLKSGFQVEDTRFYTIHPLKEIHNRVVAESNKNRFLRLWKQMEDLLVQDDGFKKQGRPYCLSLFMECRKVQS
ncbi:MAG: methyltransferase domain-containing protein [Candidatus Aminicenantes bacterium]|nr:methyltransferase domain-containing protein [Candidatus Aminicenantes bacterium]